MLVDILEEIICTKCGKNTHKTNGLCRECEQELKIQEKRETVNSYCKTCKNRCKQSEICIVVKCPRYSPNNKVVKEAKSIAPMPKDDRDTVGLLPMDKVYKKTRRKK